jgi:hypothetical protein
MAKIRQRLTVRIKYAPRRLFSYAASRRYTIISCAPVIDVSYRSWKSVTRRLPDGRTSTRTAGGSTGVDMGDRSTHKLRHTNIH